MNSETLTNAPLSYGHNNLILKIVTNVQKRITSLKYNFFAIKQNSFLAFQEVEISPLYANVRTTSVRHACERYHWTDIIYNWFTYELNCIHYLIIKYTSNKIQKIFEYLFNSKYGFGYRHSSVFANVSGKLSVSFKLLL